MLFTSRPTTRWMVVDRLSWSRSLSGVRPEASSAFSNSSSVVTLFCSLRRLICSSTSASVATMSSSRARSSRRASFTSSSRAAFRTSSRRAELEAGRGLPEGGLGPLVELALRDDAGVDVDEDPVDDLAGRREGREGEGGEEGGAEEASEQRHGAESSEKRAAPPT